MAPKRGLSKGLGKGLDSMIPDKIQETKEVIKDTAEQKTETVVNINKIEPNKGQPRKMFNEDALMDLAESIKQFGIIQPLIVQKHDKHYSIIAGERRWRAAKLAGIKEIPVVIKDYTPQEVLEIALIENIQREDLNPIEEAMAYQNLIAEFKLKQDELAERVSKSRAAIANSMRLLKLDRRVQQMIIDDMITSGHARALISIEDTDEQYNVATQVFDLKLSVRETEKLVKKLLENKDSSKEKPKSALSEQEIIILKNIEDNLKTIIGSKVSITKKQKNKGKIEIEYYSSDELERIIELFQTIHE
ncbi:MAG: ParB/RepB/Spo0J family partition protein [bacterium]|nr:ParB/RepB/Spo0J family partition protein [bacterium]